MPAFLHSQTFLLLALSAFAAGAFGALLLGGNDRRSALWGNGFAVVGSLLGLVFSAAILMTGAELTCLIPTSFPLLSLSLRVDPLAAFFVLLISGIALLCSIYALGYVNHYYRKYNLGVLGFFYNAFVASMILVVTAGHALFFLVVWEIMSLTSYFLVIYEHHEEKNIKAGTLYFIMTHIGTAFIVLAFLVAYLETGAFDFGAIKGGIAAASPFARNVIFISALIGFGAKAGIIPFHIWLPGAHPAAPSHVSALMSGIMIKTGIYMLARLCWDILPGPPPLWWGLLILLIGSTSSLLGVLYALSEHDLKRLLAYHSIENIGIILLGLGSSLVFLSAGMKVLATLGLVAALYHTLNHATFKALLFLGAGSVIAATQTRNIERYGGLIKVMPQTAFFFLVGALAISALPPFNGFFSEWMTFQSLFQGVSTFHLMTKMVFLVAIGALAFTGGLAAACFVKAFGATFLARGRSDEVKYAKEAALPLRIGMGSLALLTLLLGIFSGAVSSGFADIAASLSAFRPGEPVAAVSFSALSVTAGFASLSPPLLFAGIILTMMAVAAVFVLLTRRRTTAIGATWDCGADLTERMEITATGFSRSITTIFRGVLKPTQQTEIEYHDAKLRYFPKAGIVRMEFQDVYDAYFYRPLQKATIRIAGQIKKIQMGNINVYILYILVTLTGLLLWMI